MKRVYIFLILGICTLHLAAQSKFGVALSGLTTYQLDNIDMTRSKLNCGGEIGGVYQLQKNKFLFQTGVNINYSLLSHAVDSMSWAADMVDTEGLPFTYRGVIYNRLDKANVLELSVPLMIGFNISSFYALAGAKFAYPLRVTTTQTGLLTSYGDYNGMFYEDFDNMPQHGFVSAQPQKTKGEMDFMYDVRVCAELGGSWNLSKSSGRNGNNAIQLTLGVFAEYGVLNVLKTSNKELVEIDYSQYTSVNMNHIYSTLLAENSVVNNLRVGVRMVLLLPISGGNSYDNCHCIRSIYRKLPKQRKRLR